MLIALPNGYVSKIYRCKSKTGRMLLYISKTYRHTPVDVKISKVDILLTKYLYSLGVSDTQRPLSKLTYPHDLPIDIFTVTNNTT